MTLIEPYLWCNVTCLIPKLWHDEIGGFDESMKSWEDVDYHWRLARAGKCYTRIEQELLVYRFYSGKRRDEGLKNNRGITEYLMEKYDMMITKGCSGCGGGKRPAPSLSYETTTYRSTTITETDNDGDYRKIKYLSPNMGQHRVFGQATKTFYGYRAGGEVFLVHQKDIDLQQDMFAIIEGELKPPVSASVTANAPQLVEEAVTLDKEVTNIINKRITGIEALSKYEVSNKLIDNLMIAGYMTIGDLYDAGIDGISGVSGFAKKRATIIHDIVKGILDVP